MDIAGARVLITGGGGTLGAAFALALAARGARVCACDLMAEPLERLAEAGGSQGLEIVVRQADVTDEAQVEGLVEFCCQSLGGLDALVNNAGGAEDGLLVKDTPQGPEKFSLERWRKVLDLNLTGSFLCAREAAAQMIRQGNGGVIINMSSISRHGRRLQSGYSATKAGLAALTVTWALDLAKHRIRVAALAPGYVDTPLTRNIPQKFLEDIVERQIPLGRLGEVGEVTHALVFALENEYFTGRIIDLDGGLRF